MKAEDRLWNSFVSAMVGVVLFFITLLVVLSLVGCKTKYVPIETIKTEYSHSTDTVHKTDSVLVTEWMTITEMDSSELAAMGVRLKGIQSAYVIEKNKVKELTNKLKEQHTDTIIKTEEVQVPYPVKVEKKLSLWQKVRMRTGEGAMVVLVILAGIVAIRRR